MQEVAETMEKQNLKEESIEFYNQVCVCGCVCAQHQPLFGVTACCRLFCDGRYTILQGTRPNVTPACAGS